MKYEVKNYTHLQNIGEISNESFALHLKLYEGYVKNTNILLEKFEAMKTFDAEYFAKFTPEFAELHRRFGWEFNGMRLHELFFESLQTEEGKTSLSLGGGVAAALGDTAPLREKISISFGSFEAWKKDFENICKMRGMGWTMLVQDRQTGNLLNTWVNEHDAGMLSDVNIILNFDMFEHAYIKDFGTDRQKYLNSLFTHVNWEIISKRIS